MDVLWILIALACVPLVWALSRRIGRGRTPPEQRGRIYLRHFLIEHGTDPGLLTPPCVDELIDEATDFMDQLPDQNFHVQYTTDIGSWRAMALSSHRSIGASEE